MLARLLLNPWALALSAGALAAFLGWVAWGQFQRANAASEALRAAQATSRVLAGVAAREAEAAQEWRSLYTELSDVPTTRSCGPVFDRGGDLLRSRRDSFGAD